MSGPPAAQRQDVEAGLLAPADNPAAENGVGRAFEIVGEEQETEGLQLLQGTARNPPAQREGPPAPALPLVMAQQEARRSQGHLFCMQVT